MKKIYSILAIVLLAFVAVACSNDDATRQAEMEYGYLNLNVKAITSTNTRAAEAPADYDAMKLCVDILKDGQSVKTINNITLGKAEDIKLPKGTYTVNVSSEGWDGQQSGFDTPYYFGTTTVDIAAAQRKTVEVKCTLANVQVSVEFSQGFKENFTSAASEVISSVAGVVSRTFEMDINDDKSAYFPVGNLTAKLTVSSKKGQTLTHTTKLPEDIAARDHFVIKYNLGSAIVGEPAIKVDVDESGNKTYEWTIYIPMDGAPVDPEPPVDHIQLYNGDFEIWKGKPSGRYTIWYANSNATPDYWDSSNGGSASYIGSNVSPESSFVHGGSKSAKLETKWAVIKLAAGGLFTGKYVELISTNGAKMDWGVPFTDKPKALKGYMSYSPGTINRGTQPEGVGAPAKNQPDHYNIFIALTSEILHVGGNAEADATATSPKYEKTTTFDWQKDPRVIAYGDISGNQNDNGQWREFNIELNYHSDETPSYLIIVVSSSKWGDYFYGSDATVMYVDDLELVY